MYFQALGILFGCIWCSGIVGLAWWAITIVRHKPLGPFRYVVAFTYTCVSLGMALLFGGVLYTLWSHA